MVCSGGMCYQLLSDWGSLGGFSRLLDLPNPPKQLYIKGGYRDDLLSESVAVIGSRKMTDYGRRAIDIIVSQLVFEKKTIISGFMYGVDQYAHEVCIQNGGKTVAVMGWGIEQKLESRDRKLAGRILDSGGVIVSEWKDQRPSLWTFPVRNRIVAALSDEVIVVEAALRSGSLITARIARTLRRKLWAVPGPITSKTSQGTNALIAEGKATIWTKKPETREPASDDPVLRALGDMELSADELARSMEVPVSEVGAQLSMLTITGDVIERGGKYYARQN